MRKNLFLLLCTLAIFSFLMWLKEFIHQKPTVKVIENGKLPSNQNLLKEGIMLAVLLSDERGYMDFTSSVIRSYHKVSGNDIYLFNNGFPQLDEITLKSIYGSETQQVNIKKSSKAPVTIVLEHFLASKYEVLFVVDMKTIFLPNWKDFIMKHIFDATDGFLSLYHSSVNHNYTVDCENPIGGLCRSDNAAIDTMGAAMTRALVENHLEKYSNTPHSQAWTSFLQKEGVRILYPPKSLTMQIGQTNQGKDNCGENEVAYRFDRCMLPDWIKNGIEFYFDRCTNPDELYSPENSLKEINKEGRFWTRPAISYSFYGSKPRYTITARENVARVFSIYPGWKIWIYTDGSVPKPVIREFCEFDVRFIDMSKTKITNRMSWRFLVASEPVKMFAVRDIDSWLIPRGKAAVDEWIQSGKKFHVLRDHFYHSKFPMSGGMWGGTHDAIPNIKELLLPRRMGNGYLEDMNFLNGVIWNEAKKSVWVHDRYPSKFGEVHPYPKELEGPNLFVGAIVRRQ